LALEHLENLKPSATQSYDFVVLQATDNSIPFYESLGFVRVGGIMEKKHATSNKDEEGKENDEGVLSEIITSDMTMYITEKRGETPQEIAKKLKVDLWDMLFLNKGLFSVALTPTCKLLLGTTLRVPVPKREVPKRVSLRTASPSKAKPINSNPDEADNDESLITWYTAKENDTPTMIAKRFRLNCQQLIQANAARLPGLISKSRLKHGTRVQVSHFHIVTKIWTAYAHWSFPDDRMEAGEPSYLMCYKLERRREKGKVSVLSSLQVQVEEYTPTPLLLLPDTPSAVDPAVEGVVVEASPSTVSSTPGTSTPDSNTLPSQPTTPILLVRDTNRDSLVQLNVLCDGAMVKPSPIISKTTTDTAPTDFSAGKLQPPAPPEPESLKKPKRAPGPFVLFCQDMQDRKKTLLEGLSVAEASQLLADRWSKAPLNIRTSYEVLAQKGKQEYLAQKEIYSQKLREMEQEAQVRAPTSKCPHGEAPPNIAAPNEETAMKRKKDREVLYNKIVKVKPEALPFTATTLPNKEELKDLDGDDPTCSLSLQPVHYEYWFVLTYIPDLQWCHLVPLVKVGEFTVEDKKPRLVGRPKWKLVDERLCQEIDISSRYVIPVESRETKRSPNADKEEWDIIDKDEEDALSNGSSRASARSSTSAKNRRKRKNPDSPEEETKKGLNDELSSLTAPFASGTSTLLDIDTSMVDKTMAHQTPFNMTGDAAKATERIEVGLPPMELDLSQLQQATMISEGSCRSEDSASPPTPGSYPPCMCGSQAFCPMHQPPIPYHYAPYHHPSHYPPSHHYHYPPTHGYHPMQEHYMQSGYHQYGPPGDNWPGYGFPQGQYPSYHGMQPPPMCAPPDELSSYFTPAYPPMPPAIETPRHSRTSAVGLDLSVEREIAL
jgi:HMG (high mobility group) box/LysM domain